MRYYTVTILLGALVLSTLGGCSGRRLVKVETTVLGSFKTTRTPEELRVARQALVFSRDDEFDIVSLVVSGGDTNELRLYLTDAERVRLGRENPARTYEISYWYYEERWSERSVFGRGELASIRGASGMIVDRSRCDIHRVAMARRPVRVSYGLPMREWMEAMSRDFPHPAFALGGCVVVEGKSPEQEPAYVCAVCDAAATAWSPPKP